MGKGKIQTLLNFTTIVEKQLVIKTLGPYIARDIIFWDREYLKYKILILLSVSHLFICLFVPSIKVLSRHDTFLFFVKPCLFPTRLLDSGLTASSTRQFLVLLFMGASPSLLRFRTSTLHHQTSSFVPSFRSLAKDLIHPPSILFSNLFRCVKSQKLGVEVTTVLRLL